MRQTGRMWPLFAPAQQRLGGDVSQVLVAAASGAREKVLSELGLLRLAVSRSAVYTWTTCVIRCWSWWRSYVSIVRCRHGTSER